MYVFTYVYTYIYVYTQTHIHVYPVLEKQFNLMSMLNWIQAFFGFFFFDKLGRKCFSFFFFKFMHMFWAKLKCKHLDLKSIQKELIFFFFF